MPGYHDIDRILREIDGVLEVATYNPDQNTVTSTGKPNTRLAHGLARATGLDTIVVDHKAELGDDDLSGCFAAARAAAEAFLPGYIKEELDRYYASNPGPDDHELLQKDVDKDPIARAAYEAACKRDNVEPTELEN